MLQLAIVVLGVTVLVLAVTFAIVASRVGESERRLIQITEKLSAELRRMAVLSKALNTTEAIQADFLMGSVGAAQSRPAMTDEDEWALEQARVEARLMGGR